MKKLILDLTFSPYVQISTIYQQLLENEDNYETAISMRNMLNDLPKYLAIRIKEKYEAKGFSPFEEIWV